MDNQKHWHGVIPLIFICVVIFWIIGAVMIALQSMGIIHIAGWILALPFWAPYTIFVHIFAIILLRSIFRKRRKG